MSRKTYGQVWKSNPCLKHHEEKSGNWIARARLLILQEFLRRNPSERTKETDNEMVILAKMAFPGERPLSIHRKTRELSFFVENN